jgi:hypothetical protein
MRQEGLKKPNVTVIIKQEKKQMSSGLAPLSIDGFCSLLQSTLERDVDANHQLGDYNGRAEHLLSSVASALSVFTPELAIAYLFRKEVRCQGGAIEWGRRFQSKARSVIDFCLIINGGCAASLAIRGPRGTWDFNNPVRSDVQKIQCSMRDVPAEEGYNGWSLAQQDETATGALEQFVRSTLQSLPEVVVYVVSKPIPINRTATAVSHYGGHKCLQVVVLNGVARCDTCGQQIAASKLFSIGGGSIKVCRTCCVEARALIRQ